MPRPTNVAVLGREGTVWAAKKKRKQEQIKEIVFDEDARREFLTGFRKRNLEKKAAAKVRREQKAHEELLEARRERRKDLAERAAKNSADVEEAYGGLTSLSQGVSTDKGKGKATEEVAEYEGGEQLATVTVVEDFEVDGLGSITVAKASSEQNPPPDNIPAQRAKNDAHKPSRPRTISKAAKVRPPKFRYETKAARKVTKTKERAKATEKNAGGRGVRLSSGKPSRGGKKASRRK